MPLQLPFPGFTLFLPIPLTRATTAVMVTIQWAFTGCWARAEGLTQITSFNSPALGFPSFFPSSPRSGLGFPAPGLPMASCMGPTGSGDLASPKHVLTYYSLVGSRLE